MVNALMSASLPYGPPNRKPAVFACSRLLSRLLPKLLVHLEQHGQCKAGPGRAEHPTEEVLVTHNVGDPTAPHSRDHHPQGHEAGADGVMRRLVGAVGKIEQVEHEGGEAKAVTQLLNGNSAAGDQKILRLGEGKKNESHVGKVHRAT